MPYDPSNDITRNRFLFLAASSLCANGASGAANTVTAITDSYNTHMDTLPKLKEFVEDLVKVLKLLGVRCHTTEGTAANGDPSRIVTIYTLNSGQMVPSANSTFTFDNEQP